ncbi:hypothetical protein Q3G72_011866 [Acer saccharum]|nr:hypothetical protein Q3G72_011866 [Acer saccharum]
MAEFGRASRRIVDEDRDVKAFWADRELRRNGAGDSFDRRCEYRRWSAHQRIRSPPPSHRDEGGLIARQEIQNKLEELLGNEKYRANALDIKEKLRNSIKQGGCSSSNFISFVEWLKE